MKKIKAILILLLPIILILLSQFFTTCANRGEIRIGAILPLTGDAAQWGVDPQKAIELAVEEINQAGGIQGKIVRVIYEDDQCLPKIGTNAINKLINTDRVKVIIGAVCSSVTLAISPIAEKSKVILISPASTSWKITEAGDYIFRTILSDRFEGTAFADFVFNNLGLRKVGVVTTTTEGPMGITDNFMKRFKELGGEIPVYEIGNQNDTDFRTQLTKFKNKNLDAAYLVGYPLETGYMIKQARELGFKVKILSAQPAEDPEVRKIAGNAAEGIIFSTTTLDLKAGGEASQQFLDKFQKKYGKEPATYSAEAYDAMKIITKCAAEVGYEAENIKNCLYRVKDYDGASGKMSFDLNGDVLKPIQIKIIKNGNIISYFN